MKFRKQRYGTGFYGALRWNGDYSSFGEPERLEAAILHVFNGKEVIAGYPAVEAHPGLRVRTGRYPKATPLVLAVAFSILDTLAPAGALRPLPSLEDVAEKVRPSAAVSRTLRELDSLGVPLTLVGSLTAPILARVAQALWFPGDIVAGDDPLSALASAGTIPLNCIWFVTADPVEAERAAIMGLNTIQIASTLVPTIVEPDQRGIYVIHSIEDVLETIRAPYTQSALVLRLIIGATLVPAPTSAATTTSEPECT